MPSHPTWPLLVDDEPLDNDLARLNPTDRAHAQELLARFAANGVPHTSLQRCDAEGRDGTRLAGCVKLYDGDHRLVAKIIIDDRGPSLAYVAYGRGHQRRGGRTPDVYAIAHHRLHGTWPG